MADTVECFHESVRRAPKTFGYRQHVSIFQALKGDSVGYWSLSGNHTGILK